MDKLKTEIKMNKHGASKISIHLTISPLNLVKKREDESAKEGIK